MKTKLFLAVLLCLALIFSLTACGSSGSDTSSESSQSESVSETSEESEAISESEVEEEIEETEETEEVEETSESSEVTETSEASETSSSASGSGDDISDAIDGSTTSEESAIPFGKWAAVTCYSTADSTYHTVYVRMTKITAYSEDEAYVQEAIDLNNENSYDWGQIDLSSEDYQVPDDVDWYLLDYEVYLPEDFPTTEYGVYLSSMYFSESNIGGGGIPSNDGVTSYIGLGSNNIDLEVYSDDEEFMPGNTYAFKTLFTMVIGYQDYVFEMNTYYDGTTSDDMSVDTMYYVYFANQ